MKRFLILIYCTTIILIACGCDDQLIKKNAVETPVQSDTSDVSGDYSYYADILTDYRKVIAFRLSDTFEFDWNSGKSIGLSEKLTEAVSDEVEVRPTYSLNIGAKWSNMIVDMTNSVDAPAQSSFGYILKDINCDTIPELFWIRNDGIVLAVFTVNDNNIVLLDAFWSRYKCVITDSNEIYTIYQDGVFSSHDIRKLSVDGKLIYVKAFGIEGGSAETGTVYYEVTDGAKIFIDEPRFSVLQSKYPFEFGDNWANIQMRLP